MTIELDHAQNHGVGVLKSGKAADPPRLVPRRNSACARRGPGEASFIHAASLVGKTEDGRASAGYSEQSDLPVRRAAVGGAGHG